MAKRADRGLVGLSLAFWAAVLLLHPFADHPLNDDWVYSYSVRTLLERGVLRISDAAVATVVVQALWGALFSIVFGKGYGALRLSTLTAAWLAGSAFYLLLRRAGMRRGPASALGALFLFNPLLFVLSPSFMTDVPAASLSVIALCLSWRGLGGEKRELRWAAAGSAFAALAYGVRQSGLLIPAGLTLYLWRRRRLDAKILAVLWGAPLAAFAAHQLWYRYVHGLTRGYYDYLGRGLGPKLAQPGRYLGLALRDLGDGVMDCGLFLLPMAAAFWADEPLKRLRASPRAIAAAAIAGTALLGFLLAGGWMPYPGGCNYIGPEGLGCFNFAQKELRHMPLLGRPWFWKALSLASAAAWATVAAANAEDAHPAALFFAVPLGLAYLLQLSNVRHLFADRYLLPLVPAVLLLGSAAVGRSRRSLAALWVGAGLTAGFAWAGTSDYMKVADNAWALGEEAVRGGIPSARVWGSMEWCWEHQYYDKIEAMKRAGPGGFQAAMRGELPFCTGPFDAVVTFADAEHIPLRPLATAEFFSPLSLRRERLCLHALEKPAYWGP